MDDLWLRIVVCVVVVLVLTLYLYDSGANRVYDVAISAIVIAVTSPLFGVLAAVCAVKNKKVFTKDDNGLRFTYPNNALKKLPFFLCVFIGKKNIMPKALWKAA